MFRSLSAAALFLAAAFLVSFGDATGQQPAEKKQPAKGKFDPPELAKPDAATLKIITEKTEQLRAAVAALKAKVAWPPSKSAQAWARNGGRAR